MFGHGSVHNCDGLPLKYVVGVFATRVIARATACHSQLVEVFVIKIQSPDSQLVELILRDGNLKNCALNFQLALLNACVGRWCQLEVNETILGRSALLTV